MSPVTLQLTHQFYKALMAFFFPEKDEQEMTGETLLNKPKLTLITLCDVMEYTNKQVNVSMVWLSLKLPTPASTEPLRLLPLLVVAGLVV